MATIKGMSESELRQKMLDEILAKKGGAKVDPTHPPASEPEPEPVITKADTTGKVHLGSIIGTEAKLMVDPPFDTSYWHEAVRDFIPAKNPNYVYGQTYERFATSMALRLNTMLVGMPGTGKDEVVKQYCADFNIPYFRITGMRNVTPDMIVGHHSMEDGTMKWIPGIAEVVCRYGGMFVISEPAAMPSDTLFCVQSTWEKPGYLTSLDHPDIKDRYMPISKDTFLVMTSNVRGFGEDTDKYAATSVMDASFLNRVESVQYVSPPPSSEEIETLSRYVPGIDTRIMQKMAQFGNLLRQGWNKNEIEASWSMRNLVAWGKMVILHGSVKHGFVDTFYDKLSDKEKGTVKVLWKDVSFKEPL